MAETLGSLVDKLSVTNLKLWHVQDDIHKAAHAGGGLTPETTQRLVALNLERNRLMTEIDQVLDAAAREGGARIDPRVKIL